MARVERIGLRARTRAIVGDRIAVGVVADAGAVPQCLPVVEIELRRAA